MRFQMMMPALLAAALLAGCATQPRNQGLDSDMLATIHSEGLNLKPSGDAEFRTQTKGKVVAATAGVFAAALLGGGASFHAGKRNEAPADGYLDTKAWTLTFDAPDATAFKTPVKALDVSLQRRLAGKGIATNPEATYSLLASTAFWGLDYEKLTESDNYRVYYNISLTLMHGMLAVRTVSCTGATLEKHSYDDWMANDRERVYRDAAVIGDSCASRLLSALDLAAKEPQPLVAASAE
ncbi:MAG: hypothetical protein WBW32_13375 [Luteibacter sp.]